MGYCAKKSEINLILTMGKCPILLIVSWNVFVVVNVLKLCLCLYFDLTVNDKYHLLRFKMNKSDINNLMIADMLLSA